MIILSNCLSEVVDEGFLKVASSLVWRIKEACPETTVISYDRKTDRSDLHLNLGKIFVNRELFSLLRKKKETVLYIPVSSNGTGSILRICLLCLVNRGAVTALFALTHPMGFISRFLLKYSGAKVAVLSAQAYDCFYGIVGERVTILKAGVDLQKFTPKEPSAVCELRRKYALPEDKKIVLHVGHLRPERNVSCLGKLDEEFHGLLVLSSASRSQRDSQLQQELEQCGNLTIFDKYLPDIQEIYQLADAYLFPVQTDGACIDLPLSVLEAAACGTPVVCTEFGALKEFRGKPGFWFLESMDPQTMNQWIQSAIADNRNPRSAVLEYDWSCGICMLTGKINENGF